MTASVTVYAKTAKGLEKRAVEVPQKEWKAVKNVFYRALAADRVRARGLDSSQFHLVQGLFCFIGPVPFFVYCNVVFGHGKWIWQVCVSAGVAREACGVVKSIDTRQKAWQRLEENKTGQFSVDGQRVLMNFSKRYQAVSVCGIRSFWAVKLPSGSKKLN